MDGYLGGQGSPHDAIDAFCTMSRAEIGAECSLRVTRSATRATPSAFETCVNCRKCLSGSQPTLTSGMLSICTKPPFSSATYSTYSTYRSRCRDSGHDSTAIRQRPCAARSFGISVPSGPSADAEAAPWPQPPYARSPSIFLMLPAAPLLKGAHPVCLFTSFRRCA
jgi:hypothetical protein